MRGRRLEADVEVDGPPPIDRDDLDVGVGDQGRGDQRTAQIVDPRAFERIALLEPGDGRDMARTEGWPTGHVDRAEMRDRAGIHGQYQSRQMSLVIDLDVLLADFRAGKAFLAEQPGQFEAAGDHVLGNHRVASLHHECVAEPLGILAGRLEARQLDRRKAVLGAGLGSQDHAQLRPLRLGPRHHHCIVIALAPKQFGQQLGIRARTPSDLRRIGRVLTIGLKRGLLPERLQQIVGIANGAEALNLHHVADLAILVGHRRSLGLALWP